MKTKILVGVLFCSFMGCANKAPKSNVTSKSDPTDEAVYFVEDTVVDQSAGLQVIEALSRVYGNDPNVVGGFIGSPRCPSFLEGMFFEGSTLVFQVRGDTAHARRILESTTGSKAFRLEQVSEGNYSQQQLKSILDELRRKYDSLTDKNQYVWLGYGTTVYYGQVHSQYPRSPASFPGKAPEFSRHSF